MSSKRRKQRRTLRDLGPAEDLQLRGMTPRAPKPRVPATTRIGRCLHCGGLISARDLATWSRLVRGPCPHCGRKGW